MRPETYSSLNAVDGAWRVAMGYLYRRPIDVTTLQCPGCGREVDLAEVGRSGPIACQGCGGMVEVPGYVAAEAQRRRVKRVAGDTSAWEEWRREHPMVTVRQRLSKPVWAALLAALFGWSMLMLAVAVLKVRGN